MTAPLLRRPGIFSPILQAKVLQRYAIAASAAVLAIVLRGLLDPVLGHVAFYATVYIAVAFCAVVCGLGPAVVTGTIGFLAVFYWFVDPRNSLSISRQSELHSITGFFLVSAVLTALGVANREKQLQLNKSIAALSKEADERRHAEEDLQRAHDLLEQRVAQRTADLSKALERLKAEIEVRKQAEEQLRHLSVRLMTLQDEERRRIARDLHDSTGQILAALKLTAASVQRLGISIPALSRLVDDLNTLADEAVREIRTTSYLLHPPLLEEAGFTSAARWFVDGFAKRSGIQIECDFAEMTQRPSRDCELVLFRVLQESLTNIHRHSGASEAYVKLAWEKDRVRLNVNDNGHGIGVHRAHQLPEVDGSLGVGIAGMRERVRQLNGILEVRSGNTGTTVSVAIPVAQQEELGRTIGRFTQGDRRN